MFCHEERAGDVYGELAVPVGEREVLDVGLAEDAGRVDEHVEAAEVLAVRGDDSAAVPLVGDVTRHGVRPG